MTNALPEIARAYVQRWDRIKAVVHDQRVLAGMWNAPDERKKRELIRQQRIDELSSPNGGAA